MFKFPDPKTEDPRERRMQRFLEVIPGILTWFTLVGMFVFSFFLPIWVAIFIIIFDIYWIFRTIYIAYFSVDGYRKLRRSMNIDWWERCQNIRDPKRYLKKVKEKIRSLKESLRSQNLGNFEIKNIQKEIRLQNDFLKELKETDKVKDSILDYREIMHVVMFPTATEDASVIEPAIQAVADSQFPKEQIIILLATEEREPAEKRLGKVNYLSSKFKGVFRDFLVTAHVVEDYEMKAKGSNATFAAKELVKYLEKNKIDFKKVIFSNFDCDSVCHPQYLAALTYEFIRDPKRLQRSYQPLPMYHNNLWDTNAFVRIIVTGSSFWHIFQSTRNEGIVTFSSHS